MLFYYYNFNLYFISYILNYIIDEYNLLFENIYFMNYTRTNLRNINEIWEKDICYDFNMNLHDHLLITKIYRYFLSMKIFKLQVIDSDRCSYINNVKDEDVIC